MHFKNPQMKSSVIQFWFQACICGVVPQSGIAADVTSADRTVQIDDWLYFITVKNLRAVAFKDRGNRYRGPVLGTRIKKKEKGKTAEKKYKNVFHFK